MRAVVPPPPTAPPDDYTVPLAIAAEAAAHDVTDRLSLFEDDEQETHGMPTEWAGPPEESGDGCPPSRLPKPDSS